MLVRQLGQYRLVAVMQVQEIVFAQNDEVFPVIILAKWEGGASGIQTIQ